MTIKQADEVRAKKRLQQFATLLALVGSHNTIGFLESRTTKQAVIFKILVASSNGYVHNVTRLVASLCQLNYNDLRGEIRYTASFTNYPEEVCRILDAIQPGTDFHWNRI